jgi:hypothetical protein
METVLDKELLKYTRGADFGVNLLEPINLSKKFAAANERFDLQRCRGACLIGD